MAASNTQAKRHFSLNEVLSIIETDWDTVAQADVYISPPGDEDTGDVSVDNLPPNQLTSEAEAELRDFDGTIRHIRLSEDQDQGPTTSRRTIKRRRLEDRQWKKVDLNKDEVAWQTPKPDFLNDDLTPTGQFERFFDNALVEHIVSERIKYALSQGQHDFSTSLGEIRAFLAILLVSGYAPLPRRSLYWAQEDDVYNAAFANCMSRNRFDHIMKYLHLADNTNIPVNDKIAKVRPLYDHLNQRFLKYFPMTCEVSIDESMVPNFGKHSMKQCIRGKPIRFGCKQWVMTTPLGYALCLSPYQGASAGYDQNLGLGHSVVLDLTKKLPDDLPFHIFFDNFFMGILLQEDLASRGLRATGTIRSYRVEKCPLKILELSKENRGSFDFRTDTNSNICICSWNDNSVVSMTSNNDGVYPLSKVSRWSAKEKKKIELQQPAMIASYNKGMGGVDRMDQNVGAYRISMRTKKWWWPFFAFAIDASVQNGWFLYRMSPAQQQQPIDLLAFKRHIVNVYIKMMVSSKQIGRSLSGRPAPLDKRVPAVIRTDGRDHHLTNGPTRRRCAHCGRKTKLLCAKCQVPCHIECSADFHME